VSSQISIKFSNAPFPHRPYFTASPVSAFDSHCWRLLAQSSRHAFTLLEVMISIAFIGIAMLALLSLHHSGVQSVARTRELTQAAMLAQAMMTDAEQTRFPDPGQLSGNFNKLYPGQYPNFRYQRIVEQSQEFPDIRRVRITIFYGPGFRHTFVLTEFMHNPLPQLVLPNPALNQALNQQQGVPQGAPQ
jgi:prepilin-type N-terminal cleavage/methylation domain-containing protein